jgi:glycosyltransferase involved in cell wall biosynthesis
MKVLFDHSQPFFLAHGGFQTQIEETKRALERRGIEVEWVRWWDDTQRGDILHYFGVARPGILAQARVKNLPTVMTALFTETCNRSDARLRLQGAIVQTILAVPAGEGIKQQLDWRAFQLCDRNVVGLEAEQRVLEMVYRVPRKQIDIIPLGLSDAFLSAGCGARLQSHLICVGTITERKNCVPLAKLVRQAEVPMLFVGKPYAEADPYWLEFRALIDDRWVRHQPHVESESAMIALLQQARGAVIMSRYENWCLAAHEAAACGLPLLLPDQKWSRERFGPAAHYFTGDAARDVEMLRNFHAACPDLPAPKIPLFSWDQVARCLGEVYANISAAQCGPG